MKFAIDFNRENDDLTLKVLGAKLVWYEEHNQYEIDLTFEELESLLTKVNEIKKKDYSAVISFDPPTIYLDDRV